MQIKMFKRFNDLVSHIRKSISKRFIRKKRVYRFSKDNPFAYIRTEQDLDLFIDAILDANSEVENFESITTYCLALLWIIAAFLLKNTNPEDRSISTMLRILAETCEQAEDRNSQTIFDLLIEDCKEEFINEKYNLFKIHVFGTYSNLHKETVSECINILSVVPQEQIVKHLIQKRNSRTKKEPFKDTFFEGELKESAQKIQFRQMYIQTTAIHESGHSVAAYLLGVDIDGASIIPSHYSYGRMKYTENSNDNIEAFQDAIISYSGFAAEEVFFPSAINGVDMSSKDLRIATKRVKNEIIRKYSNSKDAYKYIFVDADELGLNINESPYIVNETIMKCMELKNEASDMILKHKELVKALSVELIVKESMTGEEIKEFLNEKCSLVGG